MTILKKIKILFRIAIISRLSMLKSMVKELLLSYSDGILLSFKCDPWCKDCECLKVAENCNN